MRLAQGKLNEKFIERFSIKVQRTSEIESATNENVCRIS